MALLVIGVLICIVYLVYFALSHSEWPSWE